MFGAFRLLLAIQVVYTHLGPSHGASLGKHAVFGFYVLSGFLMTRVLNEVYRFRVLPYATNRMLRLYPLYFLVISASALAASTLALDRFDPTISNPSSSWQWLANYLLIPMADLSVPQLVPTSWSVAVEVINYAILWLVFARSQRLAWTGLAIGVGIHVWLAAGSHDTRYFPWYSAVLPFAIGAVTYFHAHRIRDFLSKAGEHWRALLFAGYLVVLISAFLVGRINGSIVGESLFYLGIGTSALVAATLADVTVSEGARRLDRFMGDLAYPTFLIHILVAALLNVALPGLLPRSASMVAISTPLTLVLSAGMVAFQSAAIEPLRDRLRQQAIPRQSSTAT